MQCSAQKQIAILKKKKKNEKLTATFTIMRMTGVYILAEAVIQFHFQN